MFRVANDLENEVEKGLSLLVTDKGVRNCLNVRGKNLNIAQRRVEQLENPPITGIPRFEYNFPFDHDFSFLTLCPRTTS